MRGKQQTEIVKHRTNVATLILVVGLGFYKQLQLAGFGSDCADLELAYPVFLLSFRVGNNQRLRHIIAAGHDAYLCHLGPAGIDAGNGRNIQSVILLGTGGERHLGEVYRLRHAVNTTGAPIVVARGIGKDLDGKLLTVVFGGIVPTIHALVSKTVFQRIMVNQQVFGISCRIVLDAETLRHHKHHGDLLVGACHTRIAGNHLRHVSLYAMGVLSVVDSDRIYSLMSNSNRDILQVYFHPIDGFPSAILHQLRFFSKPP